MAQPRSVASVQSVSHKGVWGPSPRKILNFRPSEIVSGGMNCKIQQLASQTEHIIGPAAATPAAPTPTALHFTWCGTGLHSYPERGMLVSAD